MSNMISNQNESQKNSKQLAHIVTPNDLRNLIKRLRSCNIALISRSIRNNICCYFDLDFDGFEPNTNFLVHFISNGVEKCSHNILRPTPITWPTDFDSLVDEISLLDSYLINSDFQDRPVNWLIRNGLCKNPQCQKCKDLMIAKCEKNNFIWTCDKELNCSKYAIPVLRGTFFCEFQYLQMEKILYCLYYWSNCTPPNVLSEIMQLDLMILNAIWRRLQNVCRVAIERVYPRYRLCNLCEVSNNQQTNFQPIQLISIKFNNLYIICGKHPESSIIRLGIQIPQISSYSVADLTESWFASGTYIRVCEQKFLALRERRPDLKIELVTRGEIISRQGYFDENSAFGYLITQLTSVFKDYDSSTITVEQLKLLLAEIQWRELHGPTPLAAFEAIVEHIVAHGSASSSYTEPSIPTTGDGHHHFKQASASSGDEENSDYIWAEEYFYATIETIEEPKSIRDKASLLPKPDVRMLCHKCDGMFETYDFGLHAIMHTERARAVSNQQDSGTSPIEEKLECRHCFKMIDRDGFDAHCAILRSTDKLILHGCRICCIKFPNRASFLQHMRRTHFEHECPYRCPNCDYGSSFQRDVFQHFDKEHSHEMTILCPLCLKAFTVEEPDSMDITAMHEVSMLVHEHMATHYAMQKRLTCDHCCLSFIKKSKLIKHNQRHHNPLDNCVNRLRAFVRPFRVKPNFEDKCVRAQPMELFIANKQPNIRSDRPEDWFYPSFSSASASRGGGNMRRGLQANHSDDDSDEDFDPAAITESQTSSQLSSVVSYDDDAHQRGQTAALHQQDCDEVRNFLVGGVPVLSIPRVSYSESRNSSGKLIEALNKLPKADGVIANLSVLLTPGGLPAICTECKSPITCDHFVDTIKCPNRECHYQTLCPRAMVIHRAAGHTRPAPERYIDKQKVAYRLISLRKPTNIANEEVY